jgi:ATP-dependent RNA helicase RhlE
MGFTEPTPIQVDAIPPALAGRDILACAMTGSGKTAAFALPILQRLADGRRGRTRALVVAPTRELAAQIEQHFRELGSRVPVSVASIFGGVGMAPQEKALRKGTDVIVATPGRLLDHLSRPYASLDSVEVLVLDEADRMLDMGFLPDVKRIIARLPNVRQSMLLSATLPAPIVKLAAELLKNPVRLAVERRPTPADGVSQAVYPVRRDLKPALLVSLLRSPEVRSALVFTRTKHRADRLVAHLARAGVSAGRIHGNRSQSQRTEALAAFRNGRTRILVATDIAARGIDVQALSHVVNFDVPVVPEDYVHRVGRTARAQALGDAWTLVAPEEEGDLAAIERTIGRRLERRSVQGFDSNAPRSEGLAERPPLAHGGRGGDRRASPPRTSGSFQPAGSGGRNSRRRGRRGTRRSARAA